MKEQYCPTHTVHALLQGTRTRLQTKSLILIKKTRASQEQYRTISPASAGPQNNNNNNKAIMNDNNNE